MNATVTSAFLLVVLCQFCCSFELQPGPIGPGRCGTGLYKTLNLEVSGGLIAELMKYPWSALLVYRYEDHGAEDFFECGGSLISERYVLTAAHCVDRLNQSYKLDRIRPGEWDIVTEKDCDGTMCMDPPKDVEVESIVIHDKFSRKTFHYDIAMLKLKERVVFTNIVSPICLPISMTIKTLNTDENWFTAVGWGATEHQNETKHYKSRYKLEVQLPGVHTMSCRKYYSRKIGRTQLCAGGEFGRDTCRGDSGGGLVARRFGYYYLYGIVSFGYDNCELGIPGVYTRVTSFLDWIQENTV